MRIRVTAAAGAVLEAPEELKRFNLLVEPGLEGPALQAALGPAGRLDGVHVWVARAWLLAASPLAADPAWQAGFAGMLGFAEKHGWIEPTTGAIRAHIEPG
jgi:hypothetical protein